MTLPVEYHLQKHMEYGKGYIHYPNRFYSILSTPLLSWSAKVQFSRLMIRLGNLDVGEVPKMSLTTWAENEIKDPMVRNIFYALCRTTTYTFAPTIQLASSVLKQIQLSIKEGVLYVDGGWETIITKLRAIANDIGVQFWLKSMLWKLSIPKVNKEYIVLMMRF